VRDEPPGFQELDLQELRPANWLYAPAPRLFAAPARLCLGARGEPSMQRGARARQAAPR
jgi:hypothetical protein